MKKNKWVLEKPYLATCEVLSRCGFAGVTDPHHEVEQRGGLRLSRVVLKPEEHTDLSEAEVEQILPTQSPQGRAYKLSKLVLGDVAAYAEMEIRREWRLDAPFELAGDLPALQVSVVGVLNRDLAPKSLWLLAIQTAMHRKLKCVFTVYHLGISLDIEGQELWWKSEAGDQPQWSRNKPPAPTLALAVIRKKNFQSAIKALMEVASVPDEWDGDVPPLFREDAE